MMPMQILQFGGCLEENPDGELFSFQFSSGLQDPAFFSASSSSLQRCLAYDLLVACAAELPLMLLSQSKA